MIRGTFSSTGEAYRKLAKGITAASEEGPMSTLSTTLSDQATENANDEQLPAFAVVVIVAAVALMVIFFAAMWLRKSQSGLG